MAKKEYTPSMLKSFKCLLALSVAMILAPGNTALAKKIYKHSIDGLPIHFDPSKGGNIYASEVIHSVFDTLFAYKYLKRPYELMPSLAESFPKISDDGKTITIKIRKGIYFTDDPCFKSGKGRELVASDVVYVFKRIFDPKTKSTGTWLWKDKIEGLTEWAANGADYSKPVLGLSAPDSHTVIFRLKKNFPQFLNTLALSHAAVYPKEAIDHYGEEFGIHPVGSGPFRIKHYSRYQTTLVKNPTFRKEVFDVYWHGYQDDVHGFTGIKKLHGKTLPIVDEVQINFITQGSSRWLALSKKDDIQFAVLSPKVYSEVIKSPEPLVLKDPWQNRFKFVKVNSVSTNYYEFNLSFPEIGYHSDPKRTERNKGLRCAIRKTFDWKARANSRYNGVGGALFPGILPPGIEGYNPGLSTESIEFDIQGAKKLLSSNGWTAENLPEITFSFLTNPTQIYEFERIRAALTSIGYPKGKIKINTYPNYGQFFQDVRQGKVQIQGDVVWHFDYPDAENIFQLFYSPNKSPGANSSHYHNPEFDKIFEKAILMSPGPERAKLYQKLNQIITDDCVLISGNATSFIHMWDKDITFYPMQGMNGLTLRYVDVPDSASDKKNK